jgi:hypothetical protein
MGGDDLDDYDDNQWIQPVRGGGGGGSTKESYSHNDSEGENDSGENSSSELTGKRQRSLPEPTTPDETTPDTKKSRTEAAARSSSSSSLAQARLLVQAGIDIQNQDSNACAQFLSTLIQHYTLVAQQHNHVTVTTTDDDNDNDTDTAEAAAAAAAAAADKRSVPSCTKLLLAQYCLGRSSSKNGTTTLMERIKELVAVKQLKQWNVVQSPCIVRLLLLLRATLRFCARSDMCARSMAIRSRPLASYPPMLYLFDSLLDSPLSLGDCVPVGSTCRGDSQGIGAAQGTFGQALSQEWFRSRSAKATRHGSLWYRSGNTSSLVSTTGGGRCGHGRRCSLDTRCQRRRQY